MTRTNSERCRGVSRLITGTLSLLLILCVSSCRETGFTHGVILVEIRLHAEPIHLPDAPWLISLDKIDRDQRQCFFRIKDTHLGEMTEEWVTVGENFKSAWWLGTRGLTLREIRDDRDVVVVGKFFAELR